MPSEQQPAKPMANPPTGAGRTIREPMQIPPQPPVERQPMGAESAGRGRTKPTSWSGL